MYWPLLPMDGGLCKFYAKAGEKQPMQRQLLLVQCKQQTNPFLSVNNYTLLAISRNDKNKQLTLISKHKTRINRQKYTFCNKTSLEQLKILKNGPVRYLGLKLTIQVIKSQIHLVTQSL